MDIDNMAEQHTRLISTQKQTLQRAKARQGQRPRVRKSRQDAYAKFMLPLMLGTPKEDGQMIHSSFIPPAYHPCSTPVAQLQRIVIRELQLETHHRGTYLLLRSITPPRRMTAIMALVEDEEGDAMMLQLYQLEDESTRKAADMVSVGTILLLKEPYYKVMADGEYGLRVDHLSDVAYLDMDDTRIPEVWRPRMMGLQQTAESLKIRGNLAMGEKRYWDASTE
ncbi:hypothetical protein P152DRAFT_457918 [Eremomyces bilateralis CBS 781.70]|uniref:Uncharacterized protein n=1 Tax=Eremomyces bilateralis CBS 781.70 TaxID=1392243 RepID=A0A6G1G6H8_9PEZI|nr:uncharacterized protein P152DRAFT_457918 [Eremomyces bilateralis CBS 781.70]KAF1813561.1 hypothetical protein P152DRAFT_457918 [Eremomyces bilateralis CBS 781.70]